MHLIINNQSRKYITKRRLRTMDKELGGILWSISIIQQQTKSETPLCNGALNQKRKKLVAVVVMLLYAHSIQL